MTVKFSYDSREYEVVCVAVEAELRSAERRPGF